MAVKARIRKPADLGFAYVEVQRERRKWWRIVGHHAETDKAFREALKQGAVEWQDHIETTGKLPGFVRAIRETENIFEKM